MNKVFPRKWTGLIDRSRWTPGPWDEEAEDRVQWGDEATGLPCLLIRSDIGSWAGYVGVYPDHPAYGKPIDDLPSHKGIVFHCYANDVHYVEPEPWGDLPIDENHPEMLIDIIRLRLQLWFFGFDAAHGGDLVPGLESLLHGGVASQQFKNAMGLSAHDRRDSYRNVAYMQKCCAELAEALDPKKWTNT
jgi:hypothetical protein